MAEGPDIRVDQFGDVTIVDPDGNKHGSDA